MISQLLLRLLLILLLLFFFFFFVEILIPRERKQEGDKYNYRYFFCFVLLLGFVVINIYLLQHAVFAAHIFAKCVWCIVFLGFEWEAGGGECLLGTHTN